MAPPSPAARATAGHGSGLRATLLLAAVCVAIATWRAIHYAWSADDAYVSFRYAEHLAHGLGLVYNVGERVEGYTNFLWTLWCALGIRLGVPPETWAIDSGVALHAATIALLAWPAVLRSRTSGRIEIPLAAMAACVHQDWAIFAASGLETALFIALAVATWLALARPVVSPARAAIAGLLAAFATLTRPDGLLFALVGGAYVLVRGRPRDRSTLAFFAVLAAVGIPYAAWKLAYFGTLMPNTFYAKSAGRAWLDQGGFYLWLYARRYVILLLAPLVAIVAWRRASSDARPMLGLTTAFAGAYLLFVAWVGGDFMFARFALPATPFLLLMIEQGSMILIPRASGWRLAFAAAVTAVILFSRYPFSGVGWVRGIVDEHAFYTNPERMAQRRMEEAQLHRYFAGLPIRVAFDVAQLDLAYAGDAPVAIETATGLTDSVIARQPLATRGRVGHEKRPPIAYLIERRRVHLWLLRDPALRDSLTRMIPWVPIQLDSVGAVVLQWDPAVMAALVRRGARVIDVPAEIDTVIRDLPRLDDARVRAIHSRLARFYFHAARDTARERPFLARLEAAPPRSIAARGPDDRGRANVSTTRTPPPSGGTPPRSP